VLRRLEVAGYKSLDGVGVGVGLGALTVVLGPDAAGGPTSWTPSAYSDVW